MDESTGHLLVNEIHVLESCTDTMAGFPFVSVENIQAGSAWTILAVMWVIAWCVAERRRVYLIPSFIILIIWILMTSNSG